LGSVDTGNDFSTGAFCEMRQTGSAVVTSRADEYRRRARACLDAAHTAQNERTRAELLRLAEDWQRMAEGYDPPARQPNKLGP